MKKDKKLPVSQKTKSGPGSNPKNKFKKNQTTTAASIDKIITGPVENVKARSGRDLANEGTNVDYSEE